MSNSDKVRKRDGYPSGAAAKLQSAGNPEAVPTTISSHAATATNLSISVAVPDISGLVMLVAVLFMPLPAVVSLFGMAIRIQPS
jgi:hypothetical protein